MFEHIRSCILFGVTDRKYRKYFIGNSCTKVESSGHSNNDTLMFDIGLDGFLHLSVLGAGSLRVYLFFDIVKVLEVWIILS